MKTSTDLLRRLLALAAGCALFSSASAFKFIISDNTGLPIKWPAGTEQIRIMLGTTQNLSDGSSFNSSAQAAIDLWNASLGSFRMQGTSVAAGAAGNNNSINELAFASDVFGKAFDANTLAVTTGFTSGNANERLESDTVFNSGKSWDSYRGAQKGNTFDLRRVALHELGHNLGLDHPDEATPVQTVVAIMNSHASNLDTLADDDIQGAQGLYGPPGIPPNNNFANAAVIDFSSGTLTVAGYNTNSTKESGEPNHAGNVGGRSVWYRWKPDVTGSATIDTRGSYFDTTLAVYTGTGLGSLTEVASNDDVDPGKVQASTLAFNVAGSTTYFIAVDGFNNITNDATDHNGADSAGFKLNLNLTGVILLAPTIATQPASLTVSPGDPASFSVAVNGSSPLSYQWLYNGTVISGATDTSFRIASAQSLNAGKYSVKVTNSVGSVTSSEATLAVQAAPPPPPPPPSSSGGGGGGAPSLWFVAVLTALGFGRLLGRRPALK